MLKVGEVRCTNRTKSPSYLYFGLRRAEKFPIYSVPQPTNRQFGGPAHKLLFSMMNVPPN